MSFTTAGELSFDATPDGLSLVDTRRQPSRLFKIISGSNPYEAKEQRLKESDGTVEDLNGGYDLKVADKLLYELRGRFDVPVGAIVGAWPNPLGNGFIFEWNRPAWFKITSGSGLGPYTGTLQTTTSGTFADRSPTITSSNIYRAPSNLPSPAAGTPPPSLSADQVVPCFLARESAGSPYVWVTTAPGGLQTVSHSVYRYTCVDGELIETAYLVRITGRDITQTVT